MNQYCDLAVLHYHLKKQENEVERAKIKEQINSFVEQCAQATTINLMDLYSNNASFASKMSAMLEESAAKLYSSSLTEKDSKIVQESLGRSVAMLADAVLWDSIANDLYAQSDEDECEDDDIE